MEYLFLLTFISCSLLGKAQSKQETQDWISFYFEKYFSSTYSDNSRFETLQKGLPYYYTVQKLSFDNNKLVIEKFLWKYEKDKEPEIPEEDIVDTIMLTEVNNVEIDTSKYTWDKSPLIVKLFFREMDIKNPKQISVRTYDYIKSKLVYTGYYLTYSINGISSELKEGNWKDRFLKAFQHLVRLSGGKIVTEAF